MSEILFCQSNKGISTLAPIEPEEVLTGGVIRSLALFVRYKWREVERKKLEMGWEVACEAKNKEPGDSPPHHISNGVYIFHRGDVVYEYACQKIVVHLKDTV